MDNTYLEELTSLLQSDERLVNKDGKLLKTKITELAQQLDPELIKLLLNNSKLKKFFFKDIDEALVFNQEKFLTFVHNEAFLADSYTSFKNKIGLATGNNDYLDERNEIVLNWPYKDCILEGGQEREDQKRDEVFWNETLGADQQDVLLAPKVLAGFKKYNKDGEHEVNELTENDNFIFRGNNLLVLHTLKKRYAGKVKLIYIDPPYNTGNDGFNYNDSFNHSSWLVFIKNRLEAAKILLKDDGVIFVQCDDNEQAYLKVLMDEELGRDNFLNCIAVKMSTSAGLKMSHKTKRLLKIKEYILVYTKNSASFELSNIEELYVDKDKYETERSDKYIVNYEDDYLHWQLISLHEAYKKYAKKGQEKIDFVNENCHRIFNHVTNPSTKKAWDKLSKQDKNTYKDKVRKYNVEGSDYQYAFNDHVLIPYNPKNFEGDLWAQNYSIGGTKTDEGGVEFKNGKKREILLKRIISLTTKPGEIVCDYHLGSGTTCAVAHKMGRRYIGIEQLNYVDNDAIVRLKNVINGDQTGISKSVEWHGGGSFVYTHLKNDVNVFIEAVKDAKDSNELSELLEAVLNSNFLSYRVDPKKLHKNEFKKLSNDEQKSLLIELVDKNKLYVNYHDIDDKSYKIDENTKKLNKWMQSKD